jgi:diguanylate cyclase (GGDEF)-like protein/PAS domain S-box-containing protein
MGSNREKELEILAALAKAGVSASDPQSFCEQALAELLPLLGADAAAVYLLGERGFSLFAQRGLSQAFAEKARENPPDHPVLGRVLRERRPLLWREFSSPETQAEGIQAAFYLPLLAKDQELGVLAVAAKRPWEPSAKDLLTLELSAHFLALFLGKTLEEREKSELLERYRRFVENELFGVYIIQDDRFAFVNEGITKISGYSKEELLGRPYWEIVHPEDREMVRRNLETRLRGGPAPKAYRLRALAKDGRVKTVEIQAWAVQLSGRPAVQGIVRDVTWEAEIERLRESLLSVAHEILAGTDIPAILRRIAQAVVEHSPFQRAVVSLYDLRHDPPLLGPVVALATAGLTPEEEEKLRSQGGLPPHLRSQAFQEKFRISRSYYIPYDQVPWGPGIGLPGRKASDGWHPDDFLFIPLRGKRGIIGHISVDEPVTPKAPTLEMLAPLEVFADLAALAVERASELLELEKHKEWLRGAFGLAHKLSCFSSVEELLPGALEIIRGELRYEFGAVLLAEGEELVVAAAYSTLPDPLYVVGQRLKKETGLVGWVARERRSLRVDDVRKDPRYVPVHPEIRSELAVPILSGSELLGVLDVESVELGRFRKEDEEFLQAVAELLAVTMEGLRAKEALRDLSLRDPLTDLYNRRYLFEVLAREIRRAQRYEHFLSLALLDLDRFREVNNRFGHAQGDEVLKGVAKVLLQNLRVCDFVFRYGGDEFLLVLPETDEAGAEEAVKRLRQKLRAWSRSQDLGLVLDFSAGIATYHPQSPKTPEELLREADARMYEQKRARLA